MKTYRNKSGQKMYPICSWNRNQHKLYNALDRAEIAYYEGKVGYEVVDRIIKALSIFDEHVVNGIVYATWKDGQLIKRYIFDYDLRH